MKSKLLVVTSWLSVVFCATTAFSSSDALLKKLVEKKVLTQEEADQLKSELKKEDAQTEQLFDKVKVADWLTEMKWSGDLRLRYEYFDNEDQTNPAGATNNKNDRTRFRFRLRLGMEMKFQDWAKLGLRLASGGEDPVSANQSFQDTFSRKELRIDAAYVTIMWPCTDFISITGGKMNNPIWQPSFESPLQYDLDVTPEGIAEQVQWKFGDKKQHRLFANFGQFVLDEVSADADDPYLLDFEAGGETKCGPVQLTAAAGYSHTDNLKFMGVATASQPAAAATPAAQSTSPNRGNATRQPGGAGTTLFYLDDFDVVYGRGELAWTVCDKLLLGTPELLTFSAEYLHNLSDKYDNLSGSNIVKSPGQTDGWSLQVAFGRTKKKGEWQLLYQYKYLEADATWDAVTDSDFGLGGTDRQGHVVKATYNVRDWWQLACKASITEKISSRPNADQNQRGDSDKELLRFQADTVFKF